MCVCSGDYCNTQEHIEQTFNAGNYYRFRNRVNCSDDQLSTSAITEEERKTTQQLEETTTLKLEEETTIRKPEKTATWKLKQTTIQKPEETTTQKLKETTIGKLEKAMTEEVEETTTPELEGNLTQGVQEELKKEEGRPHEKSELSMFQELESNKTQERPRKKPTKGAVKKVITDMRQIGKSRVKNISRELRSLEPPNNPTTSTASKQHVTRRRTRNDSTTSQSFSTKKVNPGQYHDAMAQPAMFAGPTLRDLGGRGIHSSLLPLHERRDMPE